MNTLLFVDVSVQDPESWGNFQLLHGMAHDEVYRKLLAANLVPFFLPLYDFPAADNAGYLMDHYMVHLSQARLLGLPGIPDLSAVELGDPLASRDWLTLHAIVHDNENRALGLE